MFHYAISNTFNRPHDPPLKDKRKNVGVDSSLRFTIANGRPVKEVFSSRRAVVPLRLVRPREAVARPPVRNNYAPVAAGVFNLSPYAADTHFDDAIINHRRSPAA